jgi:hypothetical protein
MIGIIFMLHSLVRWLIILVGVIAAIKFAMGWMQKASVAKMDRGLLSGFSGLIDLQALLGIIVLFGMGFDAMYRIEHAVTMVIAAVIAHLPMRWKKDESANALRNNLFVVIGVFVIIILGIGVLPGMRWTFRF